MQPSRREEVIKLAARISSLRESLASATRELSAAESSLDELLGDSAAKPSKPLAPNAGEAMLAGIESPDERSLNQRIVDLIEGTCAGAEDDYDADGVLAVLRGENISSVRSGLARLAEQNKIRRTTRGRYGSMRFATPEDLATAS